MAGKRKKRDKSTKTKTKKRATKQTDVAGKLDPLLLLGASRARSEAEETIGEDLAPMAEQVTDRPIGLQSLAGIMSRPGVEKMIRENLVSVLVESTDRKHLIQRIEKWGGRASVLGKTVVLARLPRVRLTNLAALKGVKYVEANVRLEYSCDLAHQSAGLVVGNVRTVPQTGRNVLVGVVDSGIDAAHVAFRTTSGTRIVDYLDQTTEQRYSAAQIDAGHAANSPDNVGHGTHVAGIAAGNGAGAPDRRWAGVAPEADLAIVKTTMDSVDVAEGVAHIFDVADRRSQPCVVNLSLGGHFGGHDGSSVAERVIDEMSGPGRIVVVAAGNEGSSRLHAGIDLDPARTHMARWVADFEIDRQLINGQQLGFLIVQVWHQREDQLAVLLRSPAGELFAPASGSSVEIDRGSVFITASHRRAGYSDDNVTTFQIVTLPFPHLLTGWSVIAQEAAHLGAPVGAIHAWILNREMGRFTHGHTPFCLVGMPGTAFSAVTVASYATRNGWDSRAGPGAQPQLSAMNLGDVSFFSSPGPTRERHNKPEIAAPGQWLVAPLSAQATMAHVPLWTRVRNRPYAAMQGTSMAAPYVAGAIALLLEKEPDLDWAEVKRRLIKSARQDRFTRPSWNWRWGYGKLDIERFLTVEPGP